MALPPGINGKTLTFGRDSFFNGAAVTGRVIVSTRKNVKHLDSGRKLIAGDMVCVLQDGTATFEELVPNDAPGLDRYDWTYRVRFYLDGVNEQPEAFDFVLFNDDPSTIDGDTLAPVPSSIGTPISVNALRIPPGGVVGQALVFTENFGVTWGDFQPVGDYATASALSAGLAGKATLPASLRRRLLVGIPTPAAAFPAVANPAPKYIDSNTVATSIVSPYLVPANPANTGVLRWSGPPSLTSASATISGLPPLFDGTAQTTATLYASTAGEVVWDFATDAPAFAVLSQNHAASPWWMTVDGESITATTVAAPGNNFRAFEFGSRKMRRIRIRAGDGFRLAGVVIGKADSMAIPVSRRPLIGALGDSYWGGWPSLGVRPGTLKYLVGQLLGWDWRSHNVGGTGYVTSSPAGSANAFTDRVGLLSTIPLDGGLFLGGINDPTAGFQAAVATTLGTFRAAHPYVPIFVGGPWSPSSTAEASAGYQTKRTALIAETARVGGYFIDTAGWVTGTGNRSAPNLTGNADVIIGSDGTHPYEPDGTAYLAYRLAGAIADVLNEKEIVA